MAIIRTLAFGFLILISGKGTALADNREPPTKTTIITIGMDSLKNPTGQNINDLHIHIQDVNQVIMGIDPGSASAIAPFGSIEIDGNVITFRGGTLGTGAGDDWPPVDLTLTTKPKTKKN